MNKLSEVIQSTCDPQLAVPDVLFVCVYLFLSENMEDVLANAVEIFILRSYLWKLILICARQKFIIGKQF